VAELGPEVPPVEGGVEGLVEPELDGVDDAGALVLLPEDSPAEEPAFAVAPLPPYPWAYQPPPLRWNAVRLTSLRGAPAPQVAHVAGGGSLILAQTSMIWPH
jgi:hypothetical protein